MVAFTNVANWQAVAQWYAATIAKVAAPQASTHPTPNQDQLTTVENIVEDVRKKVHRDAIPFGASAYTPRNPTEILQKGSADEKDLAALLISRLAEVGIAAKVALVSADPYPDVVRSLPGLEAFNRVLVYVGGEHPLWIDPSSEFTPVSRLPVPDQGRSALIVDPTTSDLVRTPETTASDNRQIDTSEIRLKDGAPAHVIQTLESRGVFEDLLRSLATSLNSPDVGSKTERGNTASAGCGSPNHHQRRHRRSAQTAQPRARASDCGRLHGKSDHR